MHHPGMDPLDATPSIADLAGYSRLRVTHRGAIIEFPFRFLPRAIASRLGQLYMQDTPCSAPPSDQPTGGRLMSW